MNSISIGQAQDLPMVATTDKEGKIKYLTAPRIAVLIRKAARKVHPDMSASEINKFSAHSLRVWACVLLSEAGKLPDFIKNRLRWLGESYRTYLRDTTAINEQHRAALEKASAAVMKLLASNLDDSLEPESVPEDTAMGVYNDIIE